MSSGNGFSAASSWLIDKGLATWSWLTKDSHGSPPATTDTEEERSSAQKEFNIARELRNIQPSTSGVSHSVTPHWPRGPSELTYQARPYPGRTIIRLNKTPSASSQGSLDRYCPKQIRTEKPSALLRQAASSEHVFPSTSTHRASYLDTRGSIRDLRYQSSSQSSLAGSASSVSVLSGSPRYLAPKRSLSPFLTPPSTRSDLQELATSSIGTIQPDLYKKQEPLFLPSKSSGATLGRLHLSLKYDFNRSDFIVDLIKTVGLPSIERGGFNEPYVRLQLLPPVDNRRRQTEVFRGNDDKNKQLEAYWGSDTFCFSKTRLSSFKFPVAFDDLLCKILLLQILDKDRFSRNDVMGEVKISISDIDLSSDLEIWAEISRARKPKSEFQEALISMNYLPSAKRLTVIIVKTSNLHVLDSNSPAEPFAVISLVVEGKTKKKKKTPRKRDLDEPYWNEGVTFDLSTYPISKVAIEIKFFYHNPKLFGDHFLLGSCLIGPHEEGINREHWCRVINTPRQTLTLWHVLR